MSKKLGEIEQSDVLKELQTLGLKEKEAAVYLALLGLGEVGTSRISTAVGLHTQYIYLALEALEHKGLVQHVVKRGRKKFSAKHPHALVRLVAEQHHRANALSAKLEQLVAMSKDQRFEVFQGNESYVAHEFDLLREAPLGSEVLIICGSGDRFTDEMKDRIVDYEQLRRKRKVAIRYVGSLDQKEYLEHNSGVRAQFSYRLLPGLFTGEVSTDIWPHAIAFNVYGDPVTSTVHYNELIAGSYRQFFEVLWKMGK